MGQPRAALVAAAYAGYERGKGMYLDHYSFAQLAVLGATAVSAISAVALAAIWTAWGQRFPWYLRAVSLVALIGPLNWTPAVAPWVVFVVQTLGMVATLAAVRAFRGWRGKAVGRRSFRVVDAVAATIYVALVMAPLSIGSQGLRWVDLDTVLMGCGFALVGLLGAWLATRPASRWGVASRAGVALAAPAITVFLMNFAPSYQHRLAGGVTHYWRLAALLTWITPLVIAAMASPWLERGEKVQASGRARGVARRRWLASAVAVPLAAALAYGYAALLRSPGEVQAPIPTTNGYDALNEALVGFDRALPQDPWQMTDDALVAHGAATAPVRAAAQQALAYPSVVRLGDETNATAPFARYQLATAWQAEAVAASRRSDAAGMVEPIAAMLALSRQDWNGGTVLHIARCHTTLDDCLRVFRQSPSWPDDPALQRLLPTLLHWEEGLDSTQLIQERTERWYQLTDWKPRLSDALGDDQRDTLWRLWVPSVPADIRLLTLELALARYRAEHADYPDALEQLVPQILPAVPADPFAPSRPMCYRRQAGGYLLYSVGHDGVDDGGTRHSMGLPGYDYLLR